MVGFTGFSLLKTTKTRTNPNCEIISNENVVRAAIEDTLNRLKTCMKAKMA